VLCSAKIGSSLDDLRAEAKKAVRELSIAVKLPK
jgi:hypothetical protein